MGGVCAPIAAQQRELDNVRCYVAGFGDTRIREHSLLLFQVLRESGKFKERTLQSRAEIVRGTDYPEPVHGVTWG